MDLNSEPILFKEILEYFNSLELKFFKLSMVRLYNSNENNAQLDQESKQVESQIYEVLASTAMQTCLARIRTDDKCTEAVIFREKMLKLRESQINHCQKEKLYIPEKVTENLEIDYRKIESIDGNRFTLT